MPKTPNPHPFPICAQPDSTPIVAPSTEHILLSTGLHAPEANIDYPKNALLVCCERIWNNPNPPSCRHDQPTSRQSCPPIAPPHSPTNRQKANKMRWSSINRLNRICITRLCVTVAKNSNRAGGGAGARIEKASRMWDVPVCQGNGCMRLCVCVCVCPD